MRDLEINIGYIGDDIVAMCEDRDYEYAFYAERTEKEYRSRLSSTRGIITKASFALNVGARQMVLSAMALHLNAVEQHQRDSVEQGIGKSLH